MHAGANGIGWGISKCGACSWQPRRRNACVPRGADICSFGHTARAELISSPSPSSASPTHPHALPNPFSPPLPAAGKFDESRRLSNGSLMDFAHIYPMDAVFDTLEDVPQDVSAGCYGWLLGVSVAESFLLSVCLCVWYRSTPWTRCSTPWRTCPRT